MIRSRVYFHVFVDKNDDDLITSIDIGMVSESGITFEGQINDHEITPGADFEEPYVRIYGDPPTRMQVYGSESYVKKYFIEWCEIAGYKVEMWGENIHFQWSIILDLLGCNALSGVEKFPTNIYKIPFDIRTVMSISGENSDTQLPRSKGEEKMTCSESLAIAHRVKEKFIQLTTSMA
jgi:hypothetical protein